MERSALLDTVLSMVRTQELSNIKGSDVDDHKYI